jgi:glutamate--cysteine ligase
MHQLLVETFKTKETQIEQFITEKLKEASPPFYSSVDVRNAGYKIAAVDTNIFPGGFNNLCEDYLFNTSREIKRYIQQNHPQVKTIFLLTENHSRNLYYFLNVFNLLKAIEQAGYEVYACATRDDITENFVEITDAQDNKFPLHKLHKKSSQIFINAHAKQNLTADLLILNNDLSEGIPIEIQTVETPIIPSTKLGWHRRLKSNHFHKYAETTNEFAQLLGLDPWLFQAHFDSAANINLDNKQNLELLAEKSFQILEKTKENYKKYEIKDKPYLFVKNDSGTYGMGVLAVFDPKEILQMNRKTKNKLRSGKGGLESHSFILQEGVKSVDRINSQVAESVVYLIAGKPIGGFFRANDRMDEFGNLNSKGMHFSKLCFNDLKNYQNTYCADCDLKILAKAYNLIGTLATIAAARETKN